MNMNKTRSDLNVWNKWCATVNEHRKVEDIPAKELNRLLSHFFVSLKKKNGEDYEPNSLTAFQRSIPYSRVVKRLCLYLHRKEMGAYMLETQLNNE